MHEVSHCKDHARGHPTRPCHWVQNFQTCGEKWSMPLFYTHDFLHNWGTLIEVPSQGPKHYWSAWLCFILYFSIWHGPPLSYLHGKKPRKWKKLTPVWIMNNAGLNSKNIVNGGSISIIIMLFVVISRNNIGMSNVS